MLQHTAYWRGHMAAGKVVAFGPVLDPDGVYGLGIIRAADENEVDEFILRDPATVINSYSYHPMLAVVPE